MNTLNTQQIEDQIASTLRDIPNQFAKGGNDLKDTKAVLFAIGTLGEKLGFGVCGLPEHFGERAWLYDMCWFSNSPDEKLLNVPLVLESEWNMNFAWIKYDFEKLLIAKAKFKVMVFQAISKNVDNYLKKLEQGIHTYQGGISGEIYLLACYDDYEGKFRIEIIRGL